MYQRTTRDTFELWINYGYGWEHEITEYTREEIRQRCKEYRENCPQYPIKTRKRRERIAPEEVTDHA